MSGRLYTLSQKQITMPASGLPLISLYSDANTAIEIERISIVNSGGAVASPQTLDFRVETLIAATVGTAGSGVTPEPTESNQGAALFTATGLESAAPTGTLKWFKDFGCNSAQGFDNTVDAPCVAGGTLSPGAVRCHTILVEQTPTGTVTLTVTVTVRERG